MIVIVKYKKQSTMNYNFSGNRAGIVLAIVYMFANVIHLTKAPGTIECQFEEKYLIFSLSTLNLNEA